MPAALPTTQGVYTSQNLHVAALSAKVPKVYKGLARTTSLARTPSLVTSIQGMGQTIQGIRGIYRYLPDHHDIIVTMQEI